MLWTFCATRNQHHQFCRRVTTAAISMSRIFGQKNGSFPCVAFLPPGKSGESSEIEQFDNYNLFVTTQFGKEGSRRIVCHSPGRRPQVQQSTFFLLLLLATKTRHVLIIMRDTESPRKYKHGVQNIMFFHAWSLQKYCYTTFHQSCIIHHNHRCIFVINKTLQM